jgi:hypothetical protein
VDRALGVGARRRLPVRLRVRVPPGGDVRHRPRRVRHGATAPRGAAVAARLPRGRRGADPRVGGARQRRLEPRSQCETARYTTRTAFIRIRASSPRCSPGCSSCCRTWIEPSVPTLARWRPRDRSLAETSLSAIAVVRPIPPVTPEFRPGQECRSWRPARSLAREGGRRVKSRLSPRHRAFHGAGVAGHATSTASTGNGARIQAVCRHRFLSVWSICLASWSAGPRCGLTDDLSAPCWSVRRKPTHGRLTPCGN